MALSGSISGSILSGKYTLRIDWSATQSVANNTSKLTAVIYLVQASSWGLDIGARSDNTASIAGTSYTWSSPAINNSGGKTTKLATVTSGNISHNADGTKTVTISATFGIRATISGTYYSTITASASVTLDQIARATTPTLSSSSVFMGDEVTIDTVAPVYSFTHDLAYSFEGSEYTNIATGVRATYDWVTPNLASKIPNATSGTATIRCITKSSGTVIGTKYVTLTLKVPTTTAHRPTINSVLVSEATDGLADKFGFYIKGKSRLKVTISASGDNGATIRSISSTFNGRTYTGSSWTSEPITESGELSLVTTVTSSRGRSTTKTTTITVQDYTPPVINELKVWRVDENGVAMENGDHIAVKLKYSVAPLSNNNVAKMVLEYKRSTSGSGWSEIDSWLSLSMNTTVMPSTITFSTDYQYDIRLTLSDYFDAAAPYTVQLYSADVVLDISSDGKGLGFGKVSQRAGVEFARTMYDRFDTVINNGLTLYTGSGDKAIDPDETLEHLILTDKNTPAANFWYVMTMFYSTKSTTANRAQFAIPYSTDGSLWTRRYYNGAWSSWFEAPAIVATGTSGIWTYIKWADGRVELTGVYEISSMACTTTLGSWYRTDVIKPNAFPFTVYNPVLTAGYESDGYGAILWATTPTTTAKPATYYLIRPTTATIASGKIVMHVTGRWK